MAFQQANILFKKFLLPLITYLLHFTNQFNKLLNHQIYSHSFTRAIPRISCIHWATLLFFTDLHWHHRITTRISHSLHTFRTVIIFRGLGCKWGLARPLQVCTHYCRCWLFNCFYFRIWIHYTIYTLSSIPVIVPTRLDGLTWYSIGQCEASDWYSKQGCPFHCREHKSI